MQVLSIHVSLHLTFKSTFYLPPIKIFHLSLSYSLLPLEDFCHYFPLFLYVVQSCVHSVFPLMTVLYPAGPRLFGSKLKLRSLAPGKMVIQRRLVHFHNLFRAKVKPRAANMLAMVRNWTGGGKGQCSRVHAFIGATLHLLSEWSG